MGGARPWVRAQPPQHASGLRERAQGRGGRRARLRIPAAGVGAGSATSFWDPSRTGGSAFAGPGGLDPQLRYLTPGFRLVTAGPLRTGSWC